MPIEKITNDRLGVRLLFDQSGDFPRIGHMIAVTLNHVHNEEAGQCRFIGGLNRSITFIPLE